MNNNDRDPFSSLVNHVLGFPAAVYQRGSEHGKEWNRMYRGDETSHGQQPVQSCPYRPSERAAAGQIGDGSGDDGEDWMKKVAQELQKGEEKARSVYATWREEEEVENKRLAEEAAKKQQEQEDRRGRWWGRRCPRRRWNEENEQCHSTAVVPAQTESAVDQPEPPVDFDDIRKDLEKKWEQMDKDMSRFAKDADSWRKKFLDDDKLWPGTDLFGSDLPFSRPLSSLFALGMSPIFLRFEPESNAMGYLLYSAYSPLALERNHGFDKDWRNRFEDLIRAEEGKELMTAEEMEKANQASGLGWLMKRMIPLFTKEQHYPKAVKVEREEQPKLPPSDAYAEPATEQALYEAYFGDFPREPVEHPVDMTAYTSGGKKMPKPDILSTLTTTERHVDGEGHITTKTVLKRRFSDGREETEETTETSKAKPLSWHYEGQWQWPPAGETKAEEQKPQQQQPPAKQQTVLKRRFSDGREEIEETTETSKAKPHTWHYEGHWQWPPAGEAKAEEQKSQQQQPPAEQQSQAPKKGWFWSS